MIRTILVAILLSLVACKSPPIIDDAATTQADAATVAELPPVYCAQIHNGVVVGNVPCPEQRVGAAPTGTGLAHITSGLQDTAAYTLQSGDITAAMTTPPAAGGTTAFPSVATNALYVDGGVVSCPGTKSPVFDSCGSFTIGSSWTTVGSFSSIPNSYGTLRAAVQFGEWTDAGVATGNQVGCFVTLQSWELPDASVLLLSQGGSGGYVAVAQPTGVSCGGATGCTTDAGCATGSANALFGFQGISSAGVVSLQVAYDGGTIYRASAASEGAPLQ